MSCISWENILFSAAVRQLNARNKFWYVIYRIQKHQWHNSDWTIYHQRNQPRDNAENVYLLHAQGFKTMSKHTWLFFFLTTICIFSFLTISYPSRPQNFHSPPFFNSLWSKLVVWLNKMTKMTFRYLCFIFHCEIFSFCPHHHQTNH